MAASTATRPRCLHMGNYFHDTQGTRPRDPYRMAPHKQALWYDERPRGGNIMWDGPGWYAVHKGVPRPQAEGGRRPMIIRVG